MRTFEIPLLGRLYEVRVQRIRPGRYEVQDTDERGYLAWYSDAPYLSQEAATMIAEARPLPDGWTRKVRHVGNGRVVFARP